MSDQKPTDTAILIQAHQYLAGVHFGRPSTDPEQQKLFAAFYPRFNQIIQNGGELVTPDPEYVTLSGRSVRPRGSK